MTTTDTVEAKATFESREQEARRRVLLAALPFCVFVVFAVVAPFLVDFDPFAVVLREQFLPPLGRYSDGTLSLLGTDHLGRSVFAQIVEGAHVSLLVGAMTVIVASAAGVTVGVLAGYLGGWLDNMLMRLADIQLALPSILFAILIAAALGPSLMNIIVALAVTRWVVFARVARASTLAVREREFVDSARVLGASNYRIITRHILPAAMTPLTVVATMQFGLVIVAEASLSFLGLGTPPTTPSWGLTIANGRNSLEEAWWVVTMPGIALVAAASSAGWLGDRLRDYLDPHRIAGA
ncbi:MAG: ABC transporter permease [Dongiaceae bacterium]